MAKIMTGRQVLNPNEGSEWAEHGTRIVPRQKALLRVQTLGHLQASGRHLASFYKWA